MSTINLNKLIQESIAGHKVKVETKKVDPTDGLENVLVKEDGIVSEGATTEEAKKALKEKAGAIVDTVKSKLGTAAEEIKNSPTAVKVAGGVGLAAGALGAGLAAKKYLAKRKVAKDEQAAQAA